MDNIGVGQIFLVEKITKAKLLNNVQQFGFFQINLGVFIVRKCE